MKLCVNTFICIAYCVQYDRILYDEKVLMFTKININCNDKDYTKVPDAWFPYAVKLFKKKKMEIIRDKK